VGVGGFFIVLATILIYKLAEADNRRGWLWSGITLVIIMLLTNVIKLGAIGVYIGFLIMLVLMFVSKPIRRL
jgi:hypothetical protein